MRQTNLRMKGMRISYSGRARLTEKIAPVEILASPEAIPPPPPKPQPKQSKTTVDAENEEQNKVSCRH